MTGCANPALVIDPRSLPEPRQFDYWRTAACGRGYDVSPAEASGGFLAEMRLWRSSPFGFAQVSLPAGRRRRGAGEIRAEPAEHWAVALVTRGWRRTRVGDAIVEGRPGRLTVYSLDRPFEEERSALQTTYIFAPRGAVPAGAAAALDSLCARPPADAAAALFTDFATSAVRALPGLDTGQVAALARATRAMLGVLAGSPVERVEAGEATLRATLLVRCERLISQNIAAAALGPRVVERLSGVPRTTLYRLFEPHGGVAAYIQRERLRRAAAALSDPTDPRRIFEIATACGFFDPSTFSRQFRARFGATPTEYRAAVAADMPPPRRTGLADDVPAGSFADFLRSL